MKIIKKNINTTAPFVTKDKSIIRSILDKSNSPVKNESLAEATLKPGGHTLEHRHNSTEEIYYFIQGTGLMFLKGSKIKVKAGDAVLIPPGTNHALINNGKTTMKLLCACAPAYSHKDTITTESPYKLVVFDFDGTLADTVGGILATANIMAKGFKTKGYTKEKIALTIGTGLDSFLQGLFPKQYARLGARTMINIYRKIYDKKFKVALKVYPKVAQTLKFLKSKNIKMIIVSNKLKRYVVDIIKRLKLDTYFDEIMGSAEQKKMKPHPWALDYFMKKYKVKRSETLMVGDSQYDVETGKRAKVKTIFLRHGYADMKIVKNLNPDFYFDKIDELKEIV